MLKPFKRTFKIVVYDPPYLYGRHSHTIETVTFDARAGETLTSKLAFVWVGVNQIEIVNVEFRGTTAEWLSLAHEMPLIVTKEISSTSGKGNIEFNIIVPSTIAAGKYTVPAAISAKAIGATMISTGWITINVVGRSSQTVVNDVPVLVSLGLLIGLGIIVLWAYLRD